MNSRALTITSWAYDHARALLEPLGFRWLHTHAVAATAREVAAHLDPVDAAPLVAAAYLHDIGYAPSLVCTGFHPLDGARHLHHLGHLRLARLVAHHTGARYEAGIRGLGRELAAFDDEASIVTAALAYCDLTNGPSGQPMTTDQRMADIEGRYGPDSLVVTGISAAWPSLVDAVRLVEAVRAHGGRTAATARARP